MIQAKSRINNWFLLFCLICESCGGLFGCAGTPQKDMYFRMRPPTSEVPYFHKHNSIGFGSQIESQRFTFNPTNNLLNNFNFDNNNLYASDNAFAGFDLLLTYTRYFAQVPFELDLSADFAKLKFRVLDARTNDSGVLLSANVSGYKTAFFQSTSGCDFLCLDSSNSAKNKSIEDGITVFGEGTEKKVGASLAYYFNADWGTFISYNRFDDKVHMKAERLTGDPLLIESTENVGAVSQGFGFFFHPGKDILLSLNIDNVTMKWREVELSRVVTGFLFSWSFLGSP